MRHLLPLTICTVGVVALGYAAYTGHHDAIHALTVQNAKAATLKAKEAVQTEINAHKQAEATEAKLAAAEKGCQQGLIAYTNLSAVARAHLAKPVCPVQ